MTYLSEVIADAPLHYWRCADPGGSLLHDIGSSPRHMAIVTGSVGYSGPNSDGGSCALQLNNEYANTGEAIAWAGGQITLECLFWQFENSGSENQAVMFNPPGNQISLDITNVNTWNFIYLNIRVPVLGAPTVPTQTWQHVVGTYDGVNASLYLNGALQGAAVPIAPAAAGSAILNCLQNVPNGTRGFISEVAFYSSALSAARAAAHFLAIDQLGSAPVFSQAGTFGSGSGSGSPVSDLLAKIYAAVHQVFP